MDLPLALFHDTYDNLSADEKLQLVYELAQG